MLGPINNVLKGIKECKDLRALIYVNYFFKSRKTYIPTHVNIIFLKKNKIVIARVLC